MSKNLNIKTPCEKANHVCDKTQYKESTFWEKIKLNIHLLYCKACREYTKNNTKLTNYLKDSEVVCMDKKCKENIQKEMDKVLDK